MSWRDTIKKQETQEVSIEEAPKSSWRDTIKKETPQLPEDEVTAPAIGYVAGKAAQEAISKTGEAASRGLEKIAELGGTSPEQLRTIKQNFPEFKATDPIAEMNKLLETARGTNTDVNRMYAEAEKLLADKIITPDQYTELVGRAALEQNKYGQPTFAKPISQSEISKTLQPSIESTAEIVKTKQEKLLDEFADLKAKEAVAKASEQSLGQLPKKTAENIAKTTKEQVLQNPQAFDFKGMTAPEVLPIFEQEREKLIKGKETSLAELFPSLKGTSIVPAEERAFQKILKMPSKADIPGNRLQEMLREFRDVGFTEGGQLSDKPAASMSREVRKEIAKMSPEAGKLMEAENVELNKLEALEKAGYVKRQGEGIKTTVEMTDSQRNKIIKDLATAYDQANPTDVVENLQVLKDYLPEDQFKKLQLASLKLAEKRGGGIDYINANKINAILQSITKRSVSRGIATIPEAVKATLPKAVTSTAKFLGKRLYKALPALGAGIGGVAAQAAEEAIEPQESGALPTEVETEDRRNAPIPVNQQESDRIKSTYWFEKGYTPEEQLQKARLASFKAGLPANGQIDEMPSRSQKPEIRQRKEQVLAVKQAGALAPTYVEAPLKKVLKADNPAEIASVAQALQSGQDKASQEYGRVLSQIVNASPREKEAILFGLNQKPEFRELVRKIKGQENSED